MSPQVGGEESRRYVAWVCGWRERNRACSSSGLVTVSLAAPSFASAVRAAVRGPGDWPGNHVGIRSEPGGSQTTTTTYPASSFDGKQTIQVDTFNTLWQLTQQQFTPSNVTGESYTLTYGYDPNWFQNTVTDARGNTTTSCYDVDYTGTAIPGSRGTLTRTVAPRPRAGVTRWSHYQSTTARITWLRASHPRESATVRV